MDEIEKLKLILYSAINEGNKVEILRISRRLDKKIIRMMREILKQEQLALKRCNLNEVDMAL